MTSKRLPREENERAGLGDDSRLVRYDNILDQCGDIEHPTPIVRLNRVLPNRDVALYVKCEWENPSARSRTAPRSGSSTACSSAASFRAKR